MRYKVVQWATGEVGKAQLQAILQNPQFELVGVLTYSPEKDSVDAGTLCGLPETGILATTDKHKIFALDADVVCHAATKYGRFNTNTDDIEQLLASGKNVVTTTTYNHLPTYGAEIQRRFETACQSGKSSFYAAGENPGFMMQRLAATLSGLCQHIDQIILEEYFLCDWMTSRSMVFDGMLMGSAPAAVSTLSPSFRANTLQYEQELAATADVLGITLEKIEPATDVVTLEHDLNVAAGCIPKGTVAGQRLSWSGYWRGKPFLTIREYWAMTRELPKWGLHTLTNWKNNNLFRVLIEGCPSLKMDLDLYMPNQLPTHMKDTSAAHLMIAMTGVNALTEVCKARPGVMRSSVFGANKPALLKDYSVTQQLIL